MNHGDYMPESVFGKVLVPLSCFSTSLRYSVNVKNLPIYGNGEKNAFLFLLTIVIKDFYGRVTTEVGFISPSLP